MIFTKHKWESLVEKVDQAVDETIVCSGSNCDGLGEEESEWSSESCCKQRVQTLWIVCVCIEYSFGRLFEPFLSQCLADTSSLFLEDGAVTSFRKSGLVARQILPSEPSKDFDIQS
jgi:hypothetical protein